MARGSSRTHQTQARPTTGQKINIGCLPRHERCRALREDQDAGCELDSVSDGGHRRTGSCSVFGLSFSRSRADCAYVAISRSSAAASVSR